MPNSIDVSKPLVAGQTYGSLTVVGTGIRSISHFTQEAIGHIRDADAVFFGVPDGVTANFIRELNSNTYNLALHYGEDKRRLVTYVQMAEVILRAVREGKRVTAVFYGHPGFFVSPARRALAIARKEGHRTQMLPGISSTDYLFADMRIDPSQSGCQILDATDMLLRQRPVMTSGHVVLLQVGSVGDRFYSIKGFKNNKRAILFERLIEIYGENHPTYHYVGATFPGLDSEIVRRPLKAYRDPVVRASVHPACSLYLPPKDVLPVDEDMAEKLGMSARAKTTVHADPVAHPASVADYGAFEFDAIARLEVEPLGGYERKTSKVLCRLFTQMATNPDAEDAYRRNPAAYANLFSGLTEAEKEALTGGKAGPLHAVALQIIRPRGTEGPLAFTALSGQGQSVEGPKAPKAEDAGEMDSPTEMNDPGEMHEPAVVDPGEMHEPAVVDPGEMHEPAVVDPGEMHEPSVVDPGEMHEPAVVDPGEMHDPAVVDPGEMHEPAVVDPGEMHEPSVVDPGEMHDPSVVDPGEMHDPAVVDPGEMHEPSVVDPGEMHDPAVVDPGEMHESDGDLR